MIKKLKFHLEIKLEFLYIQDAVDAIFLALEK